MGQRLCINLEFNGETISNCYYHWSAYTHSTVELIELLLNDLERTASLQIDPKIRAYMAFRATGAGLSSEEYDYIRGLNGSPYFNVLKNSAFDYEPEKLNRSDGLIAFSPEGISNTMEWAEGEATINMNDLTFNFGVFDAEDDNSAGRSELIEIYDMDDGDIDELPTLSGRINFDELSKEDLPFLFSIIHSAENNGYGLVYLRDIGMYFGIIS